MTGKVLIRILRLLCISSCYTCQPELTGGPTPGTKVVQHNHPLQRIVLGVGQRGRTGREDWGEGVSRRSGTVGRGLGPGMRVLNRQVRMAQRLWADIISRGIDRLDPILE